jgi:diacylglycerol kinase family enzyme
MPTVRAHVILNRRSGSWQEGTTARVVGAMTGAGWEVQVDEVQTGAGLGRAVDAAAAGPADVVVAGGGDGTITGVAARLLDTGKALGVLPLGTFNYFAQRLGVPVEVDAAVDVLMTGVAVTAGVGQVNDRVFLNNASIGLYPSLLKRREATYRWMGRSQLASYISAAVALLEPPALVKLHLRVDGEAVSTRTPLLFVGANASQLAAFEIPGSECLTQDRLAVCITRPISSLRLAGLALKAFARGLHGAPELEVVCGREAVVTLRRKRVRVAMDGEVVRLQTPLYFRYRPDALRVIVPRPEGEPGPR